MKRRRVLLDTNVWRYVVDADAADDLMRAAHSGSATVIVAPSVTYECLRIENPELRRRVMSLITHPSLRRAMPEAYSECQELKSEIRRLRPDWLRSRPNLSEYRRLRYDWLRTTGGFWSRARDKPEVERAAFLALGAKDLGLARQESYELRERVATSGTADANTSLGNIFGLFPNAVPGWEGDLIEYWRLPALTTSRNALGRYAHPYREWLDGEVDVDVMLSQSVSFNRFWLYEVRANCLPRFWLRGAFEFLQTWHRVTDGTPCDAQLATYLVDADVVVSADKNFIRFVQRCRDEGPITIANPQRIPGGKSGVNDLLRLLA